MLATPTASSTSLSEMSARLGREDIKPLLCTVSRWARNVARGRDDRKQDIFPNRLIEGGTLGNSYEQQLVYNLFTNFIKASRALGKDEEYRKKIRDMRNRLLGPKIGSWGQLQEWAIDRDEPNDTHRHLSQLIAVHPGNQITPITTPELAEAARVSLNARGDGGTGWSKAWKISMWARLHDGNRAYKLLREQIHGNHYGNLLGFHPPFQIDGNFGYAAGVCEMLVQSQTGVVHLLPALPDAWSTGHVNGLKARGAFVVDLSWKNGKLAEAKIHSLKGQRLVIKYGETYRARKTTEGETLTFTAEDFVVKRIHPEDQPGYEKSKDVGAAPPEGADVPFDGTMASIKQYWQMWPKTEMPITWKLVEDPVDGGNVLMTYGGKSWGTHDLVTKKPYTDFEGHVEFQMMGARDDDSVEGYANSGVYLQNRYEIQIESPRSRTAISDPYSWEIDPHGIGAFCMEHVPDANAWRSNGEWQAFHFKFTAAMWDGDKMLQPARATVWWNGIKVHDNVAIKKANGGEKVTPAPHGLKLQEHGQDVRFRNIWIREK